MEKFAHSNTQGNNTEKAFENVVCAADNAKLAAKIKGYELAIVELPAKGVAAADSSRYNDYRPSDCSGIFQAQHQLCAPVRPKT
eukprot:13905-Heterococcus_DN1.PRE.2